MLLASAAVQAQEPRSSPAQPLPRAPVQSQHDPMPTPAADQALSLYQSGRTTQALAAAEHRLQSAPNDITALVVAIKVYQEQSRLDDAMRLLEPLTRHHPGMVVTWELATQVYQAAGVLARRDTALRQLIATQAAAMDRTLRDRRFVIRDRIDAQGRVVMGREYFDTGAADAIRYVFIPENAGSNPRAYLIVTSDARTTQNWQDAGILPPGKRVFHIDSVFMTPDGRQAQAMYGAYPELPDYDLIRAKVQEILSGKARPMSGQAGGLAVPAAPTGTDPTGTDPDQAAAGIGKSGH